MNVSPDKKYVKMFISFDSDVNKIGKYDLRS